MSPGGRRGWWLLAAGGAAAALWPAGRLWIVLALAAGAVLAAGAAWSRGHRKPAIAAGLVAVAWLGLWAIGLRENREAEAAIRRLYTGRVRGGQTAEATVAGPTAPVHVTVSFAAGEIAAVSFTHGEPPWMGDAQLNALATAVVQRGRLVSPRAGAFGAPVERAGLRALERALLRRPTPAWSLATALVRGEQDPHTLRTVPAVLLLVAMFWAAWPVAGGRRREAAGGGTA